MAHRGRRGDFNIDDAFAESLDDKIRIYTTTSETAPLTDTILEEPPGFETSTLSLSPGSPDTVFVELVKSQPPILKNKKILQNPTLKALKAKEEVDVRSLPLFLEQTCIITLSFSVHLPRLDLIDS